MGLWFAAFLGFFARWREGSDVVGGVALLALVALELAFLTWMRKRHGALPWPGKGTPPPEIGRLWRWYFAGGLGVVAMVALTWWKFGAPAAMVATFVLATAGLAWYERSYLVAVEAVKSRLA